MHKYTYFGFVGMGFALASLPAVAQAPIPSPGPGFSREGSDGPNGVKMDRRVWISSTDPTYKKVTQLSELPWKQTVTGRWIPNMDKIRSTTPVRHYLTKNEDWTDNVEGDYEELPGPYAVQCVPDARGRMEGHKEAYWVEYGTSGRWFGGGQWHANAVGFTNPSYSWIYSGGVSTPNFEQKVAAGLEYITSIAGIFHTIDGDEEAYGIEVSADASGSLVKANPSTFTASVTDAAGTLSNTYVVNWHPNYEKVQDLSGYPKTKRVRGQCLAGPIDAWVTAGLQAQGITDVAPVKYYFDSIEFAFAETPLTGLILMIRETDHIINDPYNINLNSYESSPQAAWGQAYFMDQNLLLASLQAPDPDKFLRIDPLVKQYEGWKTEGYQLCQASVYLVTYVKSSKWLADHYDENGFHSANHILGSDETTQAFLEPEFVFDSARASVAGLPLEGQS